MSDAESASMALDVDDVELEPGVVQQVFGIQLEAARQYVRSLATDGIVRGLIGPRERARLWTRHVLNSAALAPLLSAGQRVVDIGSGAGLPGLPLALARADCRFDLVEPLLRRSEYLQQMVTQLELTNVRVFRGRADEVVDRCGQADVVTARAVAPVAKLAGWAAPLLVRGGWLLALKGSSAGDELHRDSAVLRASGFERGEVMTLGRGEGEPGTFVIRARRH